MYKNYIFYLAFILTSTNVWSSPGCLQNKSSVRNFERCACSCAHQISDHNTCLDCGHCHAAPNQTILIDAYEELKKFNQKTCSQPYSQCWDEIKLFEKRIIAQKSPEHTS